MCNQSSDVSEEIPGSSGNETFLSNSLFYRAKEYNKKEELRLKLAT